MGLLKRAARVVIALAVVLLVTGFQEAKGEPWNQFLGPRRDGVAREAEGLPRQYPEGAQVRWQQEMGRGFGGAAIWEDSVLVVDRVRGESDIIRRLRLSDGSEVWRHEYEARRRVAHPGSRSTPATDGQLVYTVGTLGHIKALRFEDGEVVWRRHLLEDWDANLPQWAVSQSPLLMGNLLIVAPWGSEAAVVAYDKQTGEVAWTTPNRAGRDLDYQSPVPMNVDGRWTVVASGRHGYTIGVDAATGRELWSYDGYNSSWHIPSPTVLPGNRVLITGGYRAGSALLQVGRSGQGGYAVRELWQNRNLGSQMAQALYWDGHIYGNSTDTRGGLRCLNLDGEVVWDSADDGRTFERGFLLIADGLAFSINGRDGQIVVARATPDGFQDLGTIDVLGGNEVWAAIAYSDGVLVVRDHSQLVCLDLR